MELKVATEQLTLTSINQLNEDFNSGYELITEDAYYGEQLDESKLYLTAYILATGYETTLQLFLFQHKILDDISKMSRDYSLNKDILLRTLIYLLKRE